MPLWMWILIIAAVLGGVLLLVAIHGYPEDGSF